MELQERGEWGAPRNVGKEKDGEWEGNLGLRNQWKVYLKWKKEIKNEVRVASF